MCILSWRLLVAAVVLDAEHMMVRGFLQAEPGPVCSCQWCQCDLQWPSELLWMKRLWMSPLRFIGPHLSSLRTTEYWRKLRVGSFLHKPQDLSIWTWSHGTTKPHVCSEVVYANSSQRRLAAQLSKIYQRTIIRPYLSSKNTLQHLYHSKYVWQLIIIVLFNVN